MTSNDNFVSNRQVSLHGVNENSEINGKNENLLDTKLQDIGCCGDVPKVSKTNIKKRDKLLEWLKSSQLKREENNRQVFSRWIDMVDNGAIDLTSLSNYPGKASKQVNSISNLNVSLTNQVLHNPETTISQVEPIINVSPQISKTLITNPVKTTSIPAASVCPSFYTSMNNPSYYGVSQNWFSGNQTPAIYSPLQIPQQMPVGIYPGFGSYCTGSPMLSNYYQYVPLQQACTLCPPYVIPTLPGGVDPGYSLPSIQMQPLSSPDNTSSVNIDVNKWFDVLNEIKVGPSTTDNNEEIEYPKDSNDNVKDKP